VKRERKNVLIQEYELFRMLKGEAITYVQKRFTHIVNNLIGLDKIFDREKLNIKILRCLDRSWQPKITTISESKDLTTLTPASLYVKLREHELEINRLNEQETEEKQVKEIALKSAIQNTNQKSSDTETINLLTKSFGKFLRKSNKHKSQSSNRYIQTKVSGFMCIQTLFFSFYSIESRFRDIL